MITKINIDYLRDKYKDLYIYAGAFDISDKGKEITIDIGKNLIISLDKAISSTNEIVNNLSISEIIEICKLNQLKATFYPNGNCRFSRLDSSNEELKSCYISIFIVEDERYLICVAFDETQPALYKAQIVSVYKIEENI